MDLRPVHPMRGQRPPASGVLGQQHQRIGAAGIPGGRLAGVGYAVAGGINASSCADNKAASATGNWPVIRMEPNPSRTAYPHVLAKLQVRDRTQAALRSRGLGS